MPCLPLEVTYCIEGGRVERAEIAFWMAGTGYILLSFVSKEIYGLGTIQLIPFLYAILFLIFIYIGETITTRISSLTKQILYATVAVTILSLMSLFAGIIETGLLLSIIIIIRKKTPLKNNPKRLREPMWKAVIVVGIITSILGFLLGGIPLITPTLRYSTYRFFYLTAGYLLALSIAMRPNVLVLILSMILGVISTFRTVMLASLLAYIFRTLLDGWKPNNSRKIAFIITAGIVAVFLSRYWATVSIYPSWHLNPVETLLYRPGTTYTIYEKLFWMGYPLGRHQILFSTNPKLLVGHLFGRNVGYTYTIFGQPAYDFGITGLIEGILLGMVMGDSFRFRTTATLSLMLMTLAIPIGLDAFFVVAMLLNGLITSEVMICE